MPRKRRNRQVLDTQQRRLVASIIHTFNQLLPLTVVFGRVSKTNGWRLEGQCVGCTHAPTNRKGGGFTFWIEYRGQKLTHREALRMMVSDYSDYVSNCQVEGKKLKTIKNMVVNPSKDIKFELYRGKLVSLGKLIPTPIRELKGVVSEWVRLILHLKYSKNLPRPPIQTTYLEPRKCLCSQIRIKGKVYSTRMVFILL